MPRVVVAGDAAIPWPVVEAVNRALAAYRVWVLNAAAGVPDRVRVVAETPFVGPGMRRHPALAYHPARLSTVPLLFAGATPPDVVVAHCAPPERGHLSLGIEVDVMPAAIEACRARGGLVVAVVNSRMPYTYGDAQVSVELVDLAVELDAPLLSPAAMVADAASLGVAERVTALVCDGATIQTGIGAIPDAAVGGLTGHRGLGLWTEMFSDGLLVLERAGALDPDRPVTSSFCVGSPELYAHVHHNPRIRMLRTEKVNDPALIAANPAMTSINTALEVDLYGQANASRVGGRVHSGYGGQTDFIVGALHSRGGRALLALRSWHPRVNVGAVVPVLDEPVTSFQPTAVVTENGVAHLFGADEAAQAAALVDRAAHPRAREALWDAARARGLVSQVT
ncbi:MAG: acetyl-CoA hydrolase/transferase family protein [Phycicoccus sp.]